MVNSIFLMNDAELSSSAPLTNSTFMQCNVLHMAICLISQRKVWWSLWAFVQLQNYHGFLKALEESMDIYRIFLQTMVSQEAIDRLSCSHSSRIIDALSADNYFESRKSFSQPGNSVRVESLLSEKKENFSFSFGRTPSHTI